MTPKTSRPMTTAEAIDWIEKAVAEMEDYEIDWPWRTPAPSLIERRKVEEALARLRKAQEAYREAHKRPGGRGDGGVPTCY